MRHNNSGRKLSRTSAHRKALFRNMAKALLTYGRITTTESKAKELRCVVEPLITLGLKNDLHARRETYRCLGSHPLVQRLFDVVAPAFAGIAGGFTRILKLARPRKGDAAPMVVMELTHGIAQAAAGGKKEEGSGKKAVRAASGKGGGKEEKAAVSKTVKPKAPKATAPKPPRAVAKVSVPKKLKIGGE